LNLSEAEVVEINLSNLENLELKPKNSTPVPNKSMEFEIAGRFLTPEQNKSHRADYRKAFNVPIQSASLQFPQGMNGPLHLDRVNDPLQDSFQTNAEILNLLGPDKNNKENDYGSLLISEKPVDRSIDFTSKRNAGSRRMSGHVEFTPSKLDLSLLCQQTNSYIYVIGGFVENSQLQIEKYDVQKAKWEIAGSLECNRSKFSTVVTPSNNILILGGKLV